MPEHRGLIMGISEKYLGNYYLKAIEKHLEKKSYRGSLVIETVGMNEEFKVKFGLKKDY